MLTCLIKLSRVFWDSLLYGKSGSLMVFALSIVSLSQRVSFFTVLGSLQSGCFSAVIVDFKGKLLAASLRSYST